MVASTNSSGTTCSRSMADPLTRELEPASLLAELERLRDQLARSGAERQDWPAPSEKDADKALIFSCLAYGWTLDKLRTVLGESPEQAWFVTEVDRARYPLLAQARRDARLDGLLCPELGVFTESAFMASLERELDNARRKRGDLTLLLFELVRTQAEPPAALQSDAGTPPPVITLDQSESSLRLSQLCQTLKASARGCDIPGRVGNHVALIMIGAGGLRARAFAERLVVDFLDAVQRQGEGQTIDLTLRVGLSCLDCEEHPEAAVLLERAQKVLLDARPGGTRTWRASGARMAERKTEVRAAEKHFLFFGNPDSEQASSSEASSPRKARRATAGLTGELSEDLRGSCDFGSIDDFAVGFDAQGRAPECDEPEPDMDEAGRTAVPQPHYTDQNRSGHAADNASADPEATS